MRILKTLFRLFAAGFIAVAILCIVFSFYNVLPVHVTNTAGNTDYVWPANAFWLKMTEGISWGRMDEQGYNNAEVVENPDILMLGSSHMEAMNVMQNENAAYLLAQNLSDSYTVYNMGISAHHFIKVCSYLPATLSLFDNVPKAVVIEAASVSFDQTEIDALLQGTMDYTKSHDTGIIAFLQKLPFPRLVYQQIQGGLLDLFLPERAEDAVGAEKQIDAKSYDALLSYLAEVQDIYDTNIIVVYHPTATILEEGTVVFPKADGSDLFAAKCAEHGVTFVDMTEPFEQIYNQYHRVPHGFVTGAVGEGHLNAYGHQAIADTLVDVIAALEGSGKLCK